MKRPKTVVWMNRILLFRLIAILIIFFVTIVVVYINPEKGFFTGFANAILNKSNIVNPFDNPDSSAGYLTGIAFVPVFSIIFQYFYLRTRKKYGFWIAFGFDILTVISYKSFPLIPIVILILGNRESTQLYFKSRQISII